MLLPLVERFVSERRNGLVGWAIGLSVYAILIVSVFPAVRDSDSYAAALDDYPDALKELFGGEAAFQLTTAAGFLHAEVYALILPLLLSVVAIGAGAGLGADQRSGLMDLLLANPVPRRSVIVAKAAAMTIAVSGLSIVVLVTILLAGTFVVWNSGWRRCWPRRRQPSSSFCSTASWHSESPPERVRARLRLVRRPLCSPAATS